MFRCTFCGNEMESICAQYAFDLHCPLPCAQCHAHVADPYIERDSVLIFLDLVLHKPAVYRHLLFNRPDHTAAFFCKLSFILLVLDAYVHQGNVVGVVVGATAYLFSVYGMLLLLYPAVQFNIFKVQSALTLSSFAKSLYMLMVIYEYTKEVEYTWLINIFVFTSNTEALLSLLPPMKSSAGHATWKDSLPIRYAKCYGVIAVGHMFYSQSSSIIVQ